YRIDTDEQFAYDLLRARKLLITQGTGFNLGTHDHFRLVTLPSVEVLSDALDRIGDFLGTLRRCDGPPAPRVRPSVPWALPPVPWAAGTARPAAAVARAAVPAAVSAAGFATRASVPPIRTAGGRNRGNGAACRAGGVPCWRALTEGS